MEHKDPIPKRYPAGGRVKLTTTWDGKSMEGTEEFRQAFAGISDQNRVASARL